MRWGSYSKLLQRASIGPVTLLKGACTEGFEMRNFDPAGPRYEAPETTREGGSKR